MTGTAPENAESTRRDVDRVIAFSDGVFAIAITLLVLSLEVPDVTDKNLGEALKDLTPELFTYALSFAVVGMYWMAHHRTFRLVTRIDRTLLWINLVLLGFVALLPFPTEILGKYGDTSLGVVVYTASIVAVGSMSVLIWWYLNHANLIPPISPDHVRVGLLRAGVAPAVFALSIPVALFAPDWAKLVWLLILPANVVLERRYQEVSSGP